MINTSFMKLGISQTLAVNESSYHMGEGESKKTYKLGFGQSPFPIPEQLLQAYRQAATHNEYLPVCGYRPLRQEIAKYYSERDGREITEDCILVGPGSKELLYLFQLVLTDTSMYQISPAWVSYPAHSKIVNNPIKTLTTRFSDQWKLTSSSIRPLLQDTNPNKAMIITSPNNPTGMSYQNSEYQWLSKQLQPKSVIVVADEIYEKLQFNGTFVSLAKHYPSHTIISSGLSKSCSVGGWRIGYMVFPPELKHICQAMTNVASETYSCANTPSQIAAVHVFKYPERYLDYWQSCRSVLRAVCQEAVKRFHLAGIDCHVPDGSWYIFPVFEKFRSRLGEKGITDSISLAQVIQSHTEVAVISGKNFSCETLALRLCLVDFDGELAIQNIPGEYTLEWFQTYCPKVLEGIDLIVDFIQNIDSRCSKKSILTVCDTKLYGKQEVI